MQSSETESHGYFQTNGTATQKQSRKNITVESDDDEFEEITIVNTTRLRKPKKKQVSAKCSGHEKSLNAISCFL